MAHVSALVGGVYERRPITNDWHVGTLLPGASSSELLWRNRAGAAWAFSGVARVSPTAGTAVFPAGAPYAGTAVTLRIDPATARITSFLGAGGEEYVWVAPAPAAAAASSAAAAAPAPAASTSTATTAAARVPPSRLMSKPERTEAAFEFERREAAEAAAREAAAAAIPFDPHQPLRGGAYQRLPVENDWHYGTLVQVAPGTLRWANRAGASWHIEGVTRTAAAAATGVFPPGAPYAGTVAKLTIEASSGTIVSFTGAGGESFLRYADEAGTPYTAPAAAPASASPAASSGGGSGSLPELRGGLHGYISMYTPPAPPAFTLGAGYYVPCWPLTARPHRSFQIGLPGMWFTPENSDVDFPLLPKGTQARDNWPECAPTWKDHFQTIEGSMGSWTSTQFPTATAKYALNGTGDGYTLMLSSPGWSFTSTPLPPHKMGIVQVSNRLLVVPDGMPFRPGTCGPLFGTTWTALPLGTPAPGAGPDHPPTGEQAWTLFLASETFKGPVVFWLPQYWSAIGRGYPPAHGRTMDTRPCKAAGGSMEAAETPCFVAGDSPYAPAHAGAAGGAGGAAAVADHVRDGAPAGRTFVRVPQLRFPVDAHGWTDMMVDFVQLGEAALARAVRAWLDAGAGARAPFPSGAFAPEGVHRPRCDASGEGLGFDCAAGGPESARRKIAGLDGIVKRCASAGSSNSFGLQWSPEAVAAGAAGGLIALPDIYMRAPATLAGGSASDKDIYLPVSHADAPRALLDATFARKLPRDGIAYTTPTDAGSCWHTPGPVAGPFRTRLADGSVAEYFWYRFDQQPTLVARAAEVPSADVARMQRFAEAVHANWPITGRDYMPPPQGRAGPLAALDDGLIVQPPPGLEIGFVPIVTKQYYAGPE